MGSHDHSEFRLSGAHRRGTASDYLWAVAAASAALRPAFLSIARGQIRTSPAATLSTLVDTLLSWARSMKPSPRLRTAISESVGAALLAQLGDHFDPKNEQR